MLALLGGIAYVACRCYEYCELGAEYFTPSPADMLNDLYLGLSVAALGLVIWVIILLAKDPKGVIKASLFKKKP